MYVEVHNVDIPPCIHVYRIFLSSPDLLLSFKIMWCQGSLFIHQRSIHRNYLLLLTATYNLHIAKGNIITGNICNIGGYRWPNRHCHTSKSPVHLEGNGLLTGSKCLSEKVEIRGTVRLVFSEAVQIQFKCFCLRSILDRHLCKSCRQRVNTHVPVFHNCFEVGTQVTIKYGRGPNDQMVTSTLRWDAVFSHSRL